MPRTQRRLRSVLFSCIVALLTALTVLTVSAATISNGGFETGDFTGWTVVTQGTGNWFVYTGTTAPLTGVPLGSSISPPPEGNFAAVSDEIGPGTHILYQDIVLEPGVNHQLSFVLYYKKQ